MNVRIYGLICSIFFIVSFIAGTAKAGEEKITVMNPRGIMPPIRLIPMAERPASLDGKTVYIVDTKYPNTKPFVEQLYRNLQQSYPNTNWVLKDKAGNYMQDDPELWKEIKAKAQGAIVLLGH